MRKPLFALQVLLAVFVICPHAAQAQCVRDTREAKFGEGNAKLTSYACKAEGEVAPTVRVEFYRLSEAAAAGALMNKPWPEVAKVIGKTRVIDNGVRREALNLYKNYGITEEREDAFHFKAISAESSEDTDKVPAGTGRRTITYLTYPDTEGLTGQSMALPDAVKTISGTTGWPPDFKFYYRGDESCKPGDYSCLMLWRYFNTDDASHFEDRWKAQQDAVRLQNPDDPSLVDENGKPWPTPGAAPLKLINYLTKDNWPEDFIVTVGTYNGCGGMYDFSYYPRQMVLDAAAIQNVSTKPVAIGDLLGTQVEASGLRPPAPPMRGVVAAGVVPIPGSVGKLAPGESVLVPLKMTFVAPKGLGTWFAAKPSEARRTYGAIEKLAAGSIVKEATAEGSEQPPLQKAKESFGAPELPKVTPYIWGPEITLKGLTANGKRIILDELSANFLELTAGEGYGSCPYLYSYDETQRAWVNHGKVIDNATDPSKELTQDVPVSVFATRFRIAEEELEMSQINRVVLNVVRKDGETLQLMPDDMRLKDKDDSYVRILAGRSINISFSLPAGMKAADVSTSTLSVTGYYRRYSSMNVVDLRNPEPAKP